MRIFLGILKQSSLTRVADPLDICLPTVVQTMARLARELGDSLFNKTTQGIDLTDESAKYADRSEEIRNHKCVRHVGLVPRSEWHFRIGDRQIAVPITSTVTCNEIDSAIDACIEGLGLGMFLSYMVAPYRKSGQLKYILEKYETEP